MEQYISTYDRIPEKVIPYKDTLIICTETAADFIGLSKGGLFTTDITAYSTIPQDILGFILKFYQIVLNQSNMKKGMKYIVPHQSKHY